jgi:hypothetical protein
MAPRTGDKVDRPDPAMAPLGTDDEAARTPPSRDRQPHDVDGDPPGAVAIIVCGRSRRAKGVDMTERIPESVSTCLADWSIFAVMGNTMPPRDPNDDDDDDDDDEDGDAEPDEEPAVVREPDE